MSRANPGPRDAPTLSRVSRYGSIRATRSALRANDVDGVRDDHIDAPGCELRDRTRIVRRIRHYLVARSMRSGDDGGIELAIVHVKRNACKPRQPRRPVGGSAVDQQRALELRRGVA